MNRVVEGGSTDGCTVQMDGCNGGGEEVDGTGDELTKDEVVVYVSQSTKHIKV